jgi:hypothetical protein
MRSSQRPHWSRARARLARWSILLAVALLALASPAAAATWTAVSSPNLTQFSNVLWGADALSSSSAWAVGFSSSSNGNLTLTERWNGGAWSVVSSPDTDSFENHLNAVDGVSANDLWAVGHTRNGEYLERQRLDP